MCSLLLCSYRSCGCSSCRSDRKSCSYFRAYFAPSVQGINWFGFNNGQTMVDGLWAGYQNATLGDFPTVLKRIKLLGFNGLRLPFTFVDLDKVPTKALYVTGVKVCSLVHCPNAVPLQGFAGSCTARVDPTAAALISQQPWPNTGKWCLGVSCSECT